MLKEDPEIFSSIQQNLYVPAVCDVLDSLGYRNQAMHQRIRPLLPDMERCGFVGRARTVRWMETDYVMDDDPYGLEIDVIDSLKQGAVVVHSTDYSGTNAPWGELMSTVAKRNGAVGCICDSQIRDSVKIIKMGFPVYYAGIKPVDSMGRGRVMAYDVPIKCGEVLVNPGELIFADFDGVVVLPKEVERQVVTLALEKVRKENASRKELMQGETLRNVYNKYRVL
ncbi:MAG TPA: RraA family protein [Candidatus Bathyarchaeia archaeon]|nr:RraA family protein [Candidatus Bathyarchaeia archaeon]